ncbi:MAG: Nif3-like dinuclear metal center hexameric protein [Bacteroidia bacterium]
MSAAFQDIVTFLNSVAPPALQEQYDNSGLLTGNPGTRVKGVLIALDVTEDIIDEAIEKKCNLIVAHHPLIFKGIKSLTGRDWVERTVIKAIKNDIGILAVHTNLDNIFNGVNARICERLGIREREILAPKNGGLIKIVTFCPSGADEDGNSIPQKVREAMFAAGAGHIGNYDHCSYILSGTGTFRAGKGADPFVGDLEKEHHEQEERIETIAPRYLQRQIIQAMIEAHPYEEVAYDIYPLENEHPRTGAGMIGNLEAPIPEHDFMQWLKDRMNVKVIRHTQLRGTDIQRVAVCGGSGSFLLEKAISAGADVFITGDFKYHQFFDGEGNILIADIGHYESEQYTIHLLHELLTEKFTTFALRKTELITNPVNYFY